MTAGGQKEGGFRGAGAAFGCGGQKIAAVRLIREPFRVIISGVKTQGGIAT